LKQMAEILPLPVPTRGAAALHPVCCGPEVAAGCLSFHGEREFRRGACRYSGIVSGNTATVAALAVVWLQSFHRTRFQSKRRKYLHSLACASKLDAEAEVAVQRDEQNIGEHLLKLRSHELKHELQIRGLDTSTSFDRMSLIELGESAGVLPPRNSMTKKRRRARALDFANSSAPVVVALRHVPAAGSYLRVGPFTDGDRVAVPLWHEACMPVQPMWFLLDTAVRGAALSEEVAHLLGVGQGNVLKDFRFAGEIVDEMRVQQILLRTDPVLGPPDAGIAGILGLEFLHAWDVDLNISQLRCHAWRSANRIPQGFGDWGALEVPLHGNQGLLEVSAQLCGTTCSGKERRGSPLRAVVDLGQTHSSCNWIAAKQVGVNDSSDPCVRHAGNLLDLDGRQLDVHETEMGVEFSGRVSGVLEGSRLCENRLFWISDTLPMLEKLGFNLAEPCAVLGLDTVGRSRLAMSAKHRRLWIPM